jgi:hypothetical protein
MLFSQRERKKMADKKQPHKPMSGTSVFFVVGDSPHDRFEDLTKKLLKVPKEEVDEKRAKRQEARKRKQD